MYACLLVLIVDPYDFISLQVAGRKLLSCSSPFSGLPCTLSCVRDVENVLQYVNGCSICCGNSDDRFTNLLVSKKGRIMDAKGIAHSR